MEKTAITQAAWTAARGYLWAGRGAVRNLGTWGGIRPYPIWEEEELGVHRLWSAVYSKFQPIPALPTPAPSREKGINRSDTKRTSSLSPY